MNFSVQNNSLPRLIVVSQWLFGSTGRVPSIDMYFFNASPPKLILFGRVHLPIVVALGSLAPTCKTLLKVVKPTPSARSPSFEQRGRPAAAARLRSGQDRRDKLAAELARGTGARGLRGFVVNSVDIPRIMQQLRCRLSNVARTSGSHGRDRNDGHAC
jgi:hypothetical protein